MRLSRVFALVLAAASIACSNGGSAGGSAGGAAEGRDSLPIRGAVLDPAAASADSAAIIALENEWAAGAVKRDQAVFERLIAPGFVYSEDDRMITRQELIQGLVSGTDTVTEAHNEDMIVHRYGPVAVVTGWLLMKGRGAGGAFDRRYRFSDTWLEQDGKWQVVAAHDYLKPAGAK